MLCMPKVASTFTHTFAPTPSLQYGSSMNRYLHRLSLSQGLINKEQSPPRPPSQHHLESIYRTRVPCDAGLALRLGRGSGWAFILYNVLALCSVGAFILQLRGHHRFSSEEDSRQPKSQQPVPDG